MDGGSRGRWLSVVPPRGARALRLVCFPYAGSGTAPYRAWAASLPEDVELVLVQLPGREARLHEPALTRMDALADATAEHVAPLLDAPTVLFGHSMGAHLAFEVAHRLRERADGQPRRLVASGNRAPSLPYPRAPIHHLGDARLLEEFRRLGGTPEEVLENEELMGLLRPILRADLEVCETYAPVSRPPLEIPMTVMGGAKDPDVPPHKLDAWAQETRGAFRVRLFDGGHFFLHEQRAAFLAALREELARAR